MGLELATAYIRARGDTSKIAGDLQKGQGSVQNAAMGLQSKINAILGMVGIGLSISKFISEVKQGIALAERQIDAEQRVIAVVKGTGMAAGFTAGELKRMASSLQEATTFGDESILELQARLLTFKSVTGETFKLATEVALDTAAVMGTDARQAALMLGRALEDPIRGVSALRRTGVSFSEQQKVYIKQLVESNQLNKAQFFILETVRGQMGLVAREMAKTDAGKLKQVKNTLGDLQEELGKKFIKTQILFIEMQGRMTEEMTRFVGIIQNLPAEWISLAIGMGKSIVLTASLIGSVYGLVQGFTLLKASLAMVAANPITAALVVLTATVGMLAVAWMDYNRIMKEGIQIAADNVTTTAEVTEGLKKQFAELLKLEGKDMLASEDVAKTKQLIETLEERFGDLGIEFDENTNKILGTAKAFDTLKDRFKQMEVRPLQAQIAQLREELGRLNESADPRLGARIGKGLLGASTWGQGLLVFKEFFAGDTSKKIAEVGEQLAKAEAKLSEAQKETPEESLGNVVAEDMNEATTQAEALRMTLEEQLKLYGKTTEQIKVMALEKRGADIEEIARIREVMGAIEGKKNAEERGTEIKSVHHEVNLARRELQGLDNELWEFSNREGATVPMVTEFMLARIELEKLQNQLKKKQEIEGWVRTWEERVKTPLEKIEEEAQQLEDIKSKLTDDQYQRGLSYLAEQRASIGEQGKKEGGGAL